MQRTPLANAPYGLFVSVFFLLSLCGCDPPAPDIDIKIDDRFAGMSLADLQQANVDAHVDHELALIQANVNALLGPEIPREQEQEQTPEPERKQGPPQDTPEGPVESVEQAVSALRSMADSDPRKSYGLFFLAQRLVKYNDLRQALLYCRETEEFVPHLANSFEAMMLLLDLANFYALLDKMEDASRCCDKAVVGMVSISAPNEIATLLLKLAEVSLVVRLANQDSQASAKLFQIRELMIKAEKIIKEQLRVDAAGPNAKVGESQRNSTGAYVPTGPFFTGAMSWKDLADWTDILFAKIAKIQAWSSSLEEVGDTIRRITPGPIKDDALAAIIDMLIVSGPQEHIPSWLDMISEPAIKESIQRKVEKQSP